MQQPTSSAGSRRSIAASEPTRPNRWIEVSNVEDGSPDCRQTLLTRSIRRPASPQRSNGSARRSPPGSRPSRSRRPITARLRRILESGDARARALGVAVVGVPGTQRRPPLRAHMGPRDAGACDRGRPRSAPRRTDRGQPARDRHTRLARGADRLDPTLAPLGHGPGESRDRKPSARSSTSSHSLPPSS
jgi:hypothetical protein